MTTGETVTAQRYAIVHALRIATRAYRKDAHGFADIGNVKQADRFRGYADECDAIADAVIGNADVIVLRD